MHTEQIKFKTPSSTESPEILVPEDEREEEVLFYALKYASTMGNSSSDPLSPWPYDPPDHVVSPDAKAAQGGVFTVNFTLRKNPDKFSALGYAVAVAEDRVRYRAFFPVKREGERVHLQFRVPLREKPVELFDEELAGLDDEVADQTT